MLVQKVDEFTQVYQTFTSQIGDEVSISFIMRLSMLQIGNL